MSRIEDDYAELFAWKERVLEAVGDPLLDNAVPRAQYDRLDAQLAELKRLGTALARRGPWFRRYPHPPNEDAAAHAAVQIDEDADLWLRFALALGLKSEERQPCPCCGVATCP